MAGLERLIGIFQRVELIGVVELLEELKVMGVKVLIYELTQHLMVLCNRGYNTLCPPSSSATTNTEVLFCKQQAQNN